MFGLILGVECRYVVVTWRQEGGGVWQWRNQSQTTCNGLNCLSFACLVQFSRNILCFCLPILPRTLEINVHSLSSSSNVELIKWPPWTKVESSGAAIIQKMTYYHHPPGQHRHAVTLECSFIYLFIFSFHLILMSCLPRFSFDTPNILY